MIVRLTRINLILSLFTIISALLFASAACSPATTPSPFRPPTLLAPIAQPTLIVAPPLFTSTPFQVVSLASPTPLPTSVDLTPTPCTNNLTFLQDFTVPDNSTTSAGAQIDKRWLVQNSGTCNWDASYRLILIGGDALGAPTEQTLYPARAGTQAIIRILFAAPAEAGTYESAWQAYSPEGSAFGDPIYIRIIVSP